MRYTNFKAEMSGRWCRKCINERLETNLLPGDCVYGMYQNPYRFCGNMRNIVEKVKWRSLHKML